MITLLTDIASRYRLTRKGGKWVGPCPECGGSDNSDKFNLRDDGGFKCYACDFRGDIITWLRKMEGKSCPEAHTLAGLPCRALASCPAAGKCRLGDGSGGRPSSPPARRHLQPPALATHPGLPKTAEAKDPAPQWLAWAEPLVDKAVATLAAQPYHLAWLAARGIDAAAVARFRLGWLAHDQRVSRADLALPPKEGKDKLWIPSGLLIPIYTPAGIHRIRVRRPEEARRRFLPDLKYVWLEGSGAAPMVIRPPAGITPRGMVVVEAELDAIACAAAHPEVIVIALGTVSAGLPPTLRQEAEAAPVILVALDADPTPAPTATGKPKPAPGPEAVRRWRHEFRQARYWPPPAGKDPGDYRRDHQGDLAAWIESGLPPPPAPPVSSATSQDHGFSPGSYQGGEGAADNDVRIVHLPDGREIVITDNRALWDKLSAEGRLVFTGKELRHLRAACKAAGPEGHQAMADAALAVKSVFTGSHIRRGGPA